MPLCGSYYVKEVPDLVYNYNYFVDERKNIMRHMNKEQKAVHNRLA